MLFRSNFNENSSVALGGKRLLTVYVNFSRNLLELFRNDAFSRGRENSLPKLVFIAWLCNSDVLSFWPLFGVMSLFVRNVICAKTTPFILWVCLTAYESVSTVCMSIRSSGDRLGGERIGLNSHHYPCEELTLRNHRYRQNSRVINSVMLTWTSIIRYWFSLIA